MTAELADAADTMSREDIITLLAKLIEDMQNTPAVPTFSSSSPGIHDYSTGSAASILASYTSGKLNRVSIVKVGKDQA